MNNSSIKQFSALSNNFNAFMASQNLKAVYNFKKKYIIWTKIMFNLSPLTKGKISNLNLNVDIWGKY